MTNTEAESIILCSRCGEEEALPGISKCLDCVNEMLPDGGEAELTEHQLRGAIRSANRLDKRLDRLRVCVECGRAVSLIDHPLTEHGSEAYCTCEPFGPPMVRPTGTPLGLSDDTDACVVCGDEESTHTEYELVDGVPMGGGHPVCDSCRGTVDEGRSAVTGGGGL